MKQAALTALVLHKARWQLAFLHWRSGYKRTRGIVVLESSTGEKATS